MKQFYNAAIAALGFTILFSCSNGPQTDSKKIADSTNTARIDSAKSADNPTVSQQKLADRRPDADFAVEAADGGMLEVALGKLAEKNGSNADIIKFGGQMVKDHSMANMELKALAIKKQIALPAEMSEKCQKTLNDLESKNGAEFDKAYADVMVKDHKDDIDEFKKEADKGNDPQLSDWAKNTLPVLEHHLKMAESNKKNLRK